MEHRLASQLDVPLSSAGSAQAQRIAERLLEIHAPTMVVSSPLLRARQTAQAVTNRTGLAPVIRPELTEQHLGRFSGMTYDEVSREPAYEQDRTARWQWIPDGGGESYEMITRRVSTFFRWLESRGGGNSGETILIVTHAVTMRLIRGLLEDTLPIYPKEIAANGELWRVRYNGLGRPNAIESLLLDDQDMPRHGE